MKNIIITLVCMVSMAVAGDCECNNGVIPGYDVNPAIDPTYSNNCLDVFDVRTATIPICQSNIAQNLQDYADCIDAAQETYETCLEDAFLSWYTGLCTGGISGPYWDENDCRWEWPGGTPASDSEVANFYCDEAEEQADYCYDIYRALIFQCWWTYCDIASNSVALNNGLHFSLGVPNSAETIKNHLLNVRNIPVTDVIIEAQRMTAEGEISMYDLLFIIELYG